MWSVCFKLLCLTFSVVSSFLVEMASVRAELLAYLTHVLLGDGLAAEYLLLHLISNVCVCTPYTKGWFPQTQRELSPGIKHFMDVLHLTMIFNPELGLIWVRETVPEIHLCMFSFSIYDSICSA